MTHVCAQANNVTISNVSLTEPDTSASTIKIEFDISWSNSWMNNINNDAVWVFAKYKVNSDTTWYPVIFDENVGPGDKSVNPTSLGYSNGTGTDLDIHVYQPSGTGASYGCILQRAFPGSGSVDTDDIQLVWLWGVGGSALAATDDIEEVVVYAIEMVYIPSVTQYDLGDGDGVTGESSTAIHEDGVDDTAVTIDEGGKAITCDANAYDDIDDTPVSLTCNAGVEGNLSFPDGCGAFYVMKYEITQGEYTDMLNTLNRTQQNYRTESVTGADTITDTYLMSGTSSLSDRNDIVCSPCTGLGTTDPITVVANRPYRACNWLIYMDVAAFADWAGLRPWTETEFERAARGSKSAILGEFAWGNTSYAQAQTISGSEDGTETIEDGANCCYGSVTFTGGDGGSGPLRAGIFATGSSNRERAGASYYGVMELSGNVLESCVSVGFADGRVFDGTHGDGTLNTYGNADESGWPGYDGTFGVYQSSGTGYRGGIWAAGSALLTVSYRGYASFGLDYRVKQTGGRCALTAY